jgi:hypothetical protein
MDPTIYEEYRACLTSMGHKESDWGESLEKGLSSPYAAEVLELFKSFVQAVLERKRADKALLTYISPGKPGYIRPFEPRVETAEYKQLVDDRDCRRRIQKQKYYDLAIVIDGKEPYSRPE